MPKIIYIVHSTTSDNEKGVLSGRYDCPLSPLGKKQAKALKEVLPTFNHPVFCSTLKRSRQTADIIFPDAKITIDERLCEINYGTLTHAVKKDINFADHIETPFPNGESYRDVERRIKSFLDEQKYAVIVSHHAPQMALEVLCNGKTWQEAFAHDWRIQKNGWESFWIYEYNV